MNYTQDQYNDLMKHVETEFSAFLAKAESDASVTVKVDQTLAKSEDEEKLKKKPEHKEGEEEPKNDEPKPEHSHEEKPAEGQEEKPHGHSEEPKEGEHQEAGNDHCDYDQEDLEHMHKMYASMSKGELLAHHDSVKKCLDSHGMEKCGEMSMAKSETIVEIKPETVQSQDSELLKSELSAEKAISADLKKSLDTVTEILTKLVARKSAPSGKAVTNLEVIAKSDFSQEQPLSKSEITRILNTKTSDPSLKKSDRDAINAYCLNGASINTISHLLK